jgi:hypothetical protein
VKAPARSGSTRTRRRRETYFVVELLPEGDVVLELLPEGDVVLELLPEGDVVLELLLVEPDEPGVVVVPGDADGLVEGAGVPPTRSVSVRLHATTMLPATARAQRPDSNFFITDAPP